MQGAPSNSSHDKADYDAYSEVSHAPSYRSDELGYNQQQGRPALPKLVLPPKAAFIEVSSPAFGPPSPRAVDFGDAPRPRPAKPQQHERAPSNSWARFSMMMSSSQQTAKTGKDKEKTWLESTKSKSRKWVVLGSIVGMSVLAGLIFLLVWYLLHRKSGSTTPTVLSLGGLDSNQSVNAVTGSSTGTAQNLGVSSTSMAAASAAAPAAPAATTPAAVSTTPLASARGRPRTSATTLARRAHRPAYHA